MIDTRAVMRSLPLVASVLGRKYGVKVEMGGADAYTDGKTIHLPAMPSEVSDTLLAKWSGDSWITGQGMSSPTSNLACISASWLLLSYAKISI